MYFVNVLHVFCLSLSLSLPLYWFDLWRRIRPENMCFRVATMISSKILVYFALICRGKDPALAWLSLWPRCDVCGKRLAPYKRTARVQVHLGPGGWTKLPVTKCLKEIMIRSFNFHLLYLKSQAIGIFSLHNAQRAWTPKHGPSFFFRILALAISWCQKSGQVRAISDQKKSPDFFWLLRNLNRSVTYCEFPQFQWG